MSGFDLSYVTTDALIEELVDRSDAVFIGVYSDSYSFEDGKSIITRAAGTLQRIVALQNQVFTDIVTTEGWIYDKP